ncbi:MAG: uroporphyrinogen-III C-methyltransferase [Endomicrobia bacterium]|nr:uroporphyrinogen-III C-methyltransferase [Endomicrobiia bacterium]
MKQGIVYFIGAGPGDPELLTLKAIKILAQADVVIYDYLVDIQTIKHYLSPQTETICADMLGSKNYSNGFSNRQDLINKFLVEKAKQGKNVVRLKNGDPSIFGRLNEELEYMLKNKINYRIVPGITAATAAACYLGIPLTARNISSSVCLTTGHEANLKTHSFVNWNIVSKMNTIVLYMALEKLPEVVDKILKYGKKNNTPVAVISNISKINQKYVIGELKNIVENVKKLDISSPAMVIVGDVVKKENKFNWFKKAKKVLFTGISNERFFEEGIIFHIPMIEIKPLEDYTQVDKMIESFKLNNFKSKNRVDWIVFTSRFGVFYFFERMFKLKLDTRALYGIKIAAIGSSTANKLKEFGIVADIVPKEESSKGLLKEFKKISLNFSSKLKVFLPRSDIADKGLTEGLSKLGFEVFPCVIYKNVMPENLPDIDFNFFDEIIFSSPSTIRNFVKRYGTEVLRKIKIKTIGEVTQKALDEILKSNFI